MKVKHIYYKLKRLSGFIIKPCIEWVKNANFRRRARYAHYYESCKIQENVILYESFYGRGLLCNPYAMFLDMLDNPEYKNFKHIWVLDNMEEHKLEIEHFRKHKNVQFVEINTRKYLKWLCTAKYLINNSTFGTYFTKKSGQIYVNTWHGIPLKKMGYDLPNGVTESHNVIRNFLHADYLIAADDTMIDMYCRAYKLDGVFTGKIIKAGYPRYDLLALSNKDVIFNKLRASSVKIDVSKKIILYAPTWKGGSYSSPDTDIQQYINFKMFMDSQLDTNEYQVLVKVHQHIYELIKNKHKLEYMIPATIDANEILSVTDILISDFSSIYFDFLYTRKPILFYTPNLDEYITQRDGFNLSLEKNLPGQFSDSLDEICDWIRNLDEYKQYNTQKYDSALKKHCIGTGGQISNNINNIIFKNQTSNETVQCLNAKKRILIHRGEMRINGISASFSSLSHILDYNKFDVTALVTTDGSRLQNNSLKDINPNVRLAYRKSTCNNTLFEEMAMKMIGYYGCNRWFTKKIVPSKAYTRESYRVYGNCRFDYFIDFDGYNQFFDLVFLHSNIKAKCIWLHNEMKNECNIRFPSLKNIFSLYPIFDRIISCTYQVMIANRADLSIPENYKKFTYSKNAFNYERVLQGLSENNIFKYKNEDYYIANDDVTNKRTRKFIPLSSYNADNPMDEFDNKTTRFVTIGRLSPEKNHLALIDAFKKFYDENQNSMLYIIGEGPLRKQTQKKINNLRLSNNVILLGNLKNPFGFMKHCDCFILPSLHEGQGLVVLEARVVNLPIILTNFTAVKSVCIENGQLIVEHDAESICNGMKAFMNGEIPFDYNFDPEKYNQEVYKEFLSAIGENDISTN